MGEGSPEMATSGENEQEVGRDNILRWQVGLAVVGGCDALYTLQFAIRLGSDDAEVLQAWLRGGAWDITPLLFTLPCLFAALTAINAKHLFRFLLAHLSLCTLVVAVQELPGSVVPHDSLFTFAYPCSLVCTGIYISSTAYLARVRKWRQWGQRKYYFCILLLFLQSLIPVSVAAGLYERKGFFPVDLQVLLPYLATPALIVFTSIILSMPSTRLWLSFCMNCVVFALLLLLHAYVFEAAFCETLKMVGFSGGIGLLVAFIVHAAKEKEKGEKK
jgi:hypothetical protein